MKIISGGQTGADRAALDFAIQHRIPHGGWVPKGRQAEDGRIPDTYQLQEMPTDSHRARTEQNVIDSQGTVIISHGKLSKKSGSGYTARMAKKYRRPCLHLDMGKLSIDASARMLRSWVVEHRIEMLNVAGPRLSGDTTIYRTTFEILEAAFV
ncbi:MAG TPA: putative molybdenum carrier protein [Syntrophorhabdales bacterium]|nr:putative molybdenum carrier protein [Syntrophorhabdales bacterium]